MKVLVTGANGFIGARLVEVLLARDEPTGVAVKELALLDREFARVPDDSRVRTVVGDLTDAQVFAAALQPEPDLIFHLASIPGGLAEREFELGLDVNLRASVDLLEAVRRQGRRPRFVFASSVAVYGVPMPSFIDENTRPRRP